MGTKLQPTKEQQADLEKAFQYWMANLQGYGSISAILAKFRYDMKCRKMEMDIYLRANQR